MMRLSPRQLSAPSQETLRIDAPSYPQAYPQVVDKGVDTSQRGRACRQHKQCEPRHMYLNVRIGAFDPFALKW